MVHTLVMAGSYDNRHDLSISVTVTHVQLEMIVRGRRALLVVLRLTDCF